MSPLEPLVAFSRIEALEPEVVGDKAFLRYGVEPVAGDPAEFRLEVRFPPGILTVAQAARQEGVPARTQRAPAVAPREPMAPGPEAATGDPAGPRPAASERAAGAGLSALEPAVQEMLRFLAAVPTVNYTLVSDDVRLRFPLPASDLYILNEMSAETARDIYVNKFLGANPYLAAEYRRDPSSFDPAEAEARCRIEADSGPAEPAPGWEASPSRMVVLSSGGKESLLTHGLLTEAGFESVPLYVSESGRHWHTAMTACRWFAAEVPGTLRVWTTIDRFYNFMNRRMPFFRRQTGDIRADVYPYQLFTFQFYLTIGWLVARARGASGLCLGSEYDEPADLAVRGVRHWNAVMDQTQWFDARWTEHFREKGWPLAQYSAVRPLSGLMVQSILGRRYPKLFALQRSCHATHLEDPQGKTFVPEGPQEPGALRRYNVVPCGKCRKCNGVLSFMLAAGLDPTVAGYSARQVEDLFRQLPSRTTSLDPSEAEHTFHLMQERGLPIQGFPPGVRPRPHPEVEALRFDARNSRPDNLPGHVRRKVIPLLLRDAPRVLQWVPQGEGPRAGQWRTCDADALVVHGRVEKSA